MSVTSQSNQSRRNRTKGLRPPPNPPDPIVEPLDEADSFHFEARKVQRLIHHVSPWSVLKVSLLFYFSAWLVLMVSGLILWQIAAVTGLIGHLESFMADLLAEESFNVYGFQILVFAVVLGLFAVVVASAMTVLFTLIFNLISDVTGGIRLSVLEMESTRPFQDGGFGVVTSEADPG